MEKTKPKQAKDAQYAAWRAQEKKQEDK